MVNGVLLGQNVVPFKPTFDNVVLEKIIDAGTSKLVLPDSAAESMRKRWKVVGVGPKVEAVAVNDFIVFNNPNAGQIKEGEKWYIILPEKDIVAVYRS